MSHFLLLCRDAVALTALLALSGCGACSQGAGSPRVVEAVAPSYPFQASFSGTSGDVTVDAEVDGSGKVEKASVVAAGSNMGTMLNQVLANAATDAAKQWQFEGNGRQRRVRLVFAFRMMPRGTSDDQLTARFAPSYRVEVRAHPAVAQTLHNVPTP